MNLTLDDDQTLAACAEALAVGGLYVPSAERPALFAPVAITVEVGGAAFTVNGQTVNHAPARFYVQLVAAPVVDALREAVEAAVEAVPRVDYGADDRDDDDDHDDDDDDGLAAPLGGGRTSQRQYLSNRRTLMNVVMSPGTPQSTSLKLLGMLQNAELLRVSRSARVRQALQQAAKRKLMTAGVI